MKILILKASDFDWYRIKDFDNLQDVVNYMDKKNRPLILSHNFWYGIDLDSIMYAWSDIGITEEEALMLQKIRYSLKIYDDYIE